MTRPQVFTLTSLAMVAFAGNSLLCRLALKTTGIDAASFTSIRIVSGAVALWVVVRMRGGAAGTAGSWSSAFWLFAYAAGFSYAYTMLEAGIGALLLFGAVQATMIGYGLWRGERLGGAQTAGLAVALAGLVGLLLPGLSAPPAPGAALMLFAGVSWGIYSLRGRNTGDPAGVTAGNFLRAVPFVVLLSLALFPWATVDSAGALWAILSGALTSGVGYIIWYAALRGLKATSAATVQLSVPVIVALCGIIFLGEPITLRFLAASIAILGGVALVIVVRRNPQSAR